MPEGQALRVRDQLLNCRGLAAEQDVNILDFCIVKLSNLTGVIL